LSAVEVNKLHKSYGSIVAVDSISFSVTENEIFGLVGPNGAGKTTTIECLAGCGRMGLIVGRLGVRRLLGAVGYPEGGVKGV